MTTVRKRGNSWEANYLDRDSKRVLRSFKTKEEAEIFLQDQPGPLEYLTFRLPAKMKRDLKHHAIEKRTTIASILNGLIGKLLEGVK